MLFEPQRYRIEDQPHRPFVDPPEIREMLAAAASPTLDRVREVIGRALDRRRLTMQEVAVLLNADRPEAVAEIMEAAHRLKKEVYGDRIVIFAPLYIGNKCVNNCAYCGFRASNRHAVRRTLTDAEIVDEVRALERTGQKRLILVYGEHPLYDAAYIAHTVRTTYATQQGGDQIRRVNINAAPFDVEGFRTIREAGIGTYQIFQETYDPEVYRRYHLGGRKTDYDWRLTAMDRAMEAGIDDVGLGVLFGLGDWRFEVMALVRHTNHLEACYGVGPHTISFPRIRRASDLSLDGLDLIGDDEFVRLVAILRLAVPYTGLILTARETAALRDRLIRYGISQIDAGTRLEIGGYSAAEQEQDLHKEQFELMDGRSLAEVVSELIDSGYIPSFCTACYRKGRTGEHFMEFSTKGFIKRFCTPNALLTFAEYLEDYATPAVWEKGWALIEAEAARTDDPALAERLARIRRGERDILF
ncbi:MAG: [Rikenellaceae bacterium]|nr:[FeFe] hydrogenase H-cluster radical SAM maturase HydG [Rikenellaceae bacterium]